MCMHRPNMVTFTAVFFTQNCLVSLKILEENQENNLIECAFDYVHIE